MTRTGVAYVCPTSAGPIGESGSSSWPTPTARDEDRTRDAPNREGSPSLSGAVLWPTPTLCGNDNRKGSSPTSGDGLGTAVKQWPTPQARDDRGQSGGEQRAGGHDLSTEAGAKGRSLNPAWVCQLMGFPDGWADGLSAPGKSKPPGKPRASRKVSRTGPRSSKPMGTP
jgi:hypothetical protein